MHELNRSCLQVKMFLYLFLLSCCLSLSVGNEIEEFKENMKIFMNLKKEEIFLPILKRTDECKCAHDYLSNTVKVLKKLKENLNDESKAKHYLHLMQLNMQHLKDRLEKGDTVNSSKSCETKEVGLKRASHFYTKFFENLIEFNCTKSQ